MFFTLILISFSMISKVRITKGFTTLSRVKSYAVNNPEEKVEMENSDLVRPSYEAYYKSLRNGFWRSKFNSIKHVLRIGEGKIWTVFALFNLLKKVNTGFSMAKLNQQDYIVRISPAEGSKIMIWGDLQGAFHSLSRDLLHLQSLGILGDDFKLKSQSDYMIFNGDVVSRSAFQLETLGLVLRLLKENPDRVFYVRGNHESKNYWHGFGFKNELKARAGHISKQSIPLEEEINFLFDSLPVGIYVKALSKEKQAFVRVAHYGASGNDVFLPENEKKYYSFLTNNDDPVGTTKYLKISDAKEDQNALEVPLKAIINSEKNRATYQYMDGLRLISPENGITSWTIISCPTEIYRKGLKFFYDAFAIVKVSEQIEQWQITLHKQDMRALLGFENRENYLVSSQKTDQQTQKATAITFFSKEPIIQVAPKQ
jgi:hypothetical protein